MGLAKVREGKICNLNYISLASLHSIKLSDKLRGRGLTLAMLMVSVLRWTDYDSE